MKAKIIRSSIISERLTIAQIDGDRVCSRFGHDRTISFF